MKQALGLIETIGLITAVEAADAAVKAADVTLLGYENSKGGGKITIKLVGGVGAVQAAVAAGVAAASRIGQVYGQRVIPRPHNEIQTLIDNLDRGRGGQETAAAPKIEAEAAIETEVETAVSEPEPDEPAAASEDANTTPPLCSAVTKSGARCKLPALADSDYCFVHRKQNETDNVVE